MKIKVLIPIFCSVFIGFIFGKIIFNQYDSKAVNTFEEKKLTYFIQIGQFSSKTDVEKSIVTVDEYLCIQENDSYFVYAGITKNKNTANKIKDFYAKQFNNVIIKQKNIVNEPFLNILNEYDKITSITTTEKDLISIEKIVLSNYKEMILET